MLGRVPSLLFHSSCEPDKMKVTLLLSGTKFNKCEEVGNYWKRKY